MNKELKCPKCGSEKRVKSGFMKKAVFVQRMRMPIHGERGYPGHTRRKTIQLYLEGNVFRQIERILNISHGSVINWVRKGRRKIRENP